MTYVKYVMVVFVFGFFSCNGKQEAVVDVEEGWTPVTVVSPSFGVLQDSIELNATSSYLQSAYARSISVGYIKSVHVKPGEFVRAGQALFTVQTKESMIIGNSISRLDSSFKFSGISTVKASQSGFITQLNHQPGDYVQDGEQLAVISDNNSFVFLLNLPYELRPLVLHKKEVDLFLPDGTHLEGHISTIMPTVDSLSQTQQVVIKVNTSSPIPQNLIARVKIIKELKLHAQTLPREAVLSDEAQTSFWVMKLIDSATAVKTPVKKGLEQQHTIEILQPQFGAGDQVLLTGNYGLPDTARVIVQKQ